MKKFVAWLLVCLMVVSSLPIAAFAEAGATNAKCPGKDMIHTLDNCDSKPVSNKQPICGTAGELGYECLGCGKGFIIEVTPESNTHAFETIEEAIEMICNQDPEKAQAGKTALEKCTICGFEQGGKEIPVEHDMELVKGLEAIDGNVYYGEYECTVCGLTETIDNTDHPEYLSHNWATAPSTKPEDIVAPTCKDFGSVKYYCADEDCDAVKTVLILKTDCLAENLVKNEGTPAECEKDGVKAHYKCDICGATYADAAGKTALTDLKINKFNHYAEGENKDNVEWIIDEEPTCTDKGSKHRVCSICEKTLTEEIKELGHSKDMKDISYTVVTPADCNTTGKAKWYCDRCGEWIEEDIKKTAHSWAKEGYFSTPACETLGFAYLACEICDARKGAGLESKVVNKVTVYEVLGKTENGFDGEYGAGIADMDLDGKITDADKVDGAFLTCDATGKIEALGHTSYEDAAEGSLNEIKYCDKGGIRTWDCGRCDKSLAEAIAATGHTNTTYTIAGTCQDKAYTVVYCTNKWCTLDLETEYEAEDGTIYDLTITTYDPTSKALLNGGAGVKLISCTIGDVASHADTAERFDYNAYKANPNNYLPWYYTLESINLPTCTDDGNWFYYCKLCSEVQDNETRNEVLEKLGHDFDHDDCTVCTDKKVCTVKFAQIKDNAEQHNVKCSRCDVVEAQNHNWGKKETVNNCAEGTYDKYTCKDCGYVKTENHEKFDFTFNYKDLAAAVAGGHTELTAEDLTHHRPATCEIDGVYTYLCPTCDKSVLVVDKAEGHIYGVKAEDAVCEQEYTCTREFEDKSVCGNKEVLRHHDWNTTRVEFKAPTCTAAGNYPYFTCKNTVPAPTAKDPNARKQCECVKALDGTVYASKANLEIAQLDHKVEKKDAVSPANCEQFQYGHIDCAFCDNNSKAALEAAIKAGLNDECYYNAEYIRSYVAALGHDYVNNADKDAEDTVPTCEKPGINNVICSRPGCGKEGTEETPALGHITADGVEFTADCSDELAFEDRVCVREDCDGDDKDEDGKIDVKHASLLDVDYPATCYQEGYKGTICTACTYVKKDVIYPKEETHTMGAFTGKDGAFVEGASKVVNEETGEREQVCKWYDGVNCTEKKTILNEKIEYVLEYSNALNADAKNFAQGSIIALTLKVKNPSALKYAGNRVTILYNDKIVDFIRAEYKSTYFEDAIANDDKENSRVGYIDNAPYDPTTNTNPDVIVDGEDVLAVFYFRIHGNATADDAFMFEAGKAAFTFDYSKTQASTAAGDKLTLAENEGATVAYDLFMDADGNKAVELPDVMKIIELTNAKEYDARADLDKDGDVDFDDAIALREYLVFINDEWDMYAKGVTELVKDEVAA